MPLPVYLRTLTLTLMLTGCATQTPQLPPDRANDPAAILGAASSIEDPARRSTYLLQATDRFQQMDDHPAAQKILAGIQFDRLGVKERDQFLLLSLRSALRLSDAPWAAQLAERIDPQFIQRLPEDIQVSASILQVNALALAGHYERALQLQINNIPRYDVAQRKQAYKDVWSWVNALDDNELKKLADGTVRSELQGWAQLAQLARTKSSDLERQAFAIRDWQNRWKNHPAARNLPQELELIAAVPEKRPGRIVLTVPLTGPLAEAGAAIREGFLAAYFADAHKQKLDTRVEVVDSGAGDFAPIYNKIAASKPDLIIGPLDKGAVNLLAQVRTLPVPVLALNYMDDDKTPPANLYQFGLSQADEQLQIAKRLATEGRQNVMLLAPQGPWGEKAAQSFRESLEKNGGKILSATFYSAGDDLRKKVSGMFGLDGSRQRSTQIEQILAQPLGFEPRRRQDADALVLIAAPGIARQLKPLFSFYYGEDLPVYASSIVYSGHPDRGRDKDLEGITFTDLPWVLDNNAPMRKALHAAHPKLAAQNDRLFALGADAWLLSTRLSLLENRATQEIEGTTGLLRMNEHHEIHRQQPWAHFRNGSAEKLSIAP